MESDRLQLVDNIRIAIAAQNNQQDILRTAAEMIDGFSDGYNWTGFYLMKGDNTLEVGPYVGPETSHVEIELNSGICGAAASEKRSIIIDNVADDPRFLACSITTKSEIVVPLIDGPSVIGEIDIDSDQPSFFTSADRSMLEEIAKVLVDRLKAVNAV